MEAGSPGPHSLPRSTNCRTEFGMNDLMCLNTCPCYLVLPTECLQVIYDIITAALRQFVGLTIDPICEIARLTGGWRIVSICAQSVSLLVSQEICETLLQMLVASGDDNGIKESLVNCRAFLVYSHHHCLTVHGQLGKLSKNGVVLKDIVLHISCTHNHIANVHCFTMQTKLQNNNVDGS